MITSVYTQGGFQANKESVTYVTRRGNNNEM
jgi:hypothetical protein